LLRSINKLGRSERHTSFHRNVFHEAVLCPGTVSARGRFLPQILNFHEDTTMKKFAIACAALVVVASMAVSAKAADAVSKSTLSSMGFSSIQLISDNDGLAVRGKGTSASVWGESTANHKGQTSTNGYAADSSHRKGSSGAVGANLSVAGTVKVKYNSNGLSVKANLGVAGGFSGAKAW
jgi:hypothetical protein